VNSSNKLGRQSVRYALFLLPIKGIIIKNMDKIINGTTSTSKKFKNKKMKELALIIKEALRRLAKK